VHTKGKERNVMANKLFEGKYCDNYSNKEIFFNNPSVMIHARNCCPAFILIIVDVRRRI
jgi:hypothetical protein